MNKCVVDWWMQDTKSVCLLSVCVSALTEWMSVCVCVEPLPYKQPKITITMPKKDFKTREVITSVEIVQKNNPLIKGIAKISEKV